MREPAVVVEDVTVRFRPYLERRPTLRRTVANVGSRVKADVTALDSVSFTVNKGEAYGIVGRNGAGKSTLLKVVAGTLRPDAGRSVSYGNTSSLLQLGVGFNAQLSGARNIYLGGLAAGLRKKEIDGLFDEIVDYAELWDAIDRPVKTYSSGMFARLAFSVSMHLDPDILLLDEVLAVGDESFKEKSEQAMSELLERSGTIIFVSHNLVKVADFCDRALWLDSGSVQLEGEAENVVEHYRARAAVRRDSGETLAE